MTIVEQPLSLQAEKDIAGGYRAVGAWKPLLNRTGGIDIDIDRAQEGFLIQLNGEVFRDPDRPQFRPKLVPLALSSQALHGIAQTCREEWENAVLNFSLAVPSAQGGQENRFPFDEGWEDVVDAAAFKQIAGRLAVAGQDMYNAIFKSDDDSITELSAKLKRMARGEEQAITINANTRAFHVPWRMIYTHPDHSPPLEPDGKNCVPEGFWGYRHILEDFPVEHDLPGELCATDSKLRFGTALHPGIDRLCGLACIEQHREFINKSAQRLMHAEWTTTGQVKSALSARPLAERIIYFLCHGEGAGTVSEPNLELAALELTDGKINAVNVRQWISKFTPHNPFVFINACRGGHLGSLLYPNFGIALEFLKSAALCVVGPQIPVPAGFAAAFGRRFFEQFISDPDTPPPLVGDVLRSVTRHFWDRRNPLGLVYSLYAYADCHVRWN